jgi:hypothetical protein
VSAKYFFGERGYGQISGGPRVLELAAGSRGSNAMARRSLAIVHAFEIRVCMGVRVGATHDGGGSQPEERHGLSAEVHMIDCRRKNPVRKVFG